jgi:hypothetical protein
MKKAGGVGFPQCTWRPRKGGDSPREASGESKTKGLSKSREPKNDALPANPLVIMHALLLSGTSAPSSDLLSRSFGNAFDI